MSTANPPAARGLSRFGSLGSAAANAAGQGIWAAGQMAVLIFLSHQGLQRLVGVFSLGLGVFAVATLFLGLNLRVAISTDREDAIGFRTALQARLLACLVAWPLAVATMAFVGAPQHELIAAALLVGARIPDQLSDVIAGFYVRDDRQRRISRSFMMRGSFAIAAVAVTWGLGATLPTLGLLALLAAVGATLVSDIVPERRRHVGKPAKPLRDLIGRTWSISPYPALDSLHVNSLRFALAMVTGPAFYGLVAIAQVLYSPFQVVMTAFGFGYLVEAKRAHDDGGARALKRHVRKGLLIGGSIGLGFVLTCLFLPDFLARLLFADMAAQSADPLLVAAIAIGLSPLCGFLSLCIITGSDRTSYLSAPLVGLAIVWAIMPLLLLVNLPQRATASEAALIVACLFALSYVARLIVSLRALRATIGRGATACAAGGPP